MSEWPGTLTRIDAIRIIENITDKEDPAWEWAVEDFYDEESDTFPTLYEVLQTLGVTEAEYKSATNEQNTNWPEVSDELYISQQARIDSLEAELSTLKAQREWVSVEERLPAHYNDVITLNAGGGMRIDHNTTAGKFTADFPVNPAFPVTHWMPLPPAPEGERDG